MMHSPTSARQQRTHTNQKCARNALLFRQSVDGAFC